MAQSVLNLNTTFGTGFARLLSDDEAEIIALQVEGEEGYSTVWQASTTALVVTGPVGQSVVLETTGGTIATAGLAVSITAPAAAASGSILQAGQVDGQTVTVINPSANSITFAIAGTSNVADGVSDVIATLTARRYCWSAAASRWYRCA